MPGLALAGGKSGKKNYKEGLKYEQLQQWDLAAQQYALAVAAEPDNSEYKLHYQRALQQASVMFLKRGDDLAAQNDFAGAYSAYRSAWSYDQGNEISRLKMERMVDQQKAQAAGIDPGKINAAGNIRPTSNDVQVAAKPRSKDVVQSINFKEAKLKTVVTNLGKQLGLNVVFDESIKDTQVSIDLNDVTVSRALDIIFKTYKCSFEQVDRRTILVYTDNPTNRPRFETLLVKTFYLGNINGNQARTVVQGMLPPGRVIQTLDQGQTQGGNLLVVKATQQELQLVGDLLGGLDKNKNEVMMDMEIYEVNNGTSSQIGQQITTSGNYGAGIPTFGLSNLGGFGYTALQNGGLFGLPTTSLSLLQNKSNSKLLYSTQIHALDGQKNVTKVGQSVPVRVGTTYTGSPVINTQGNVQQQLQNQIGGFNNGTVDNIQYRDVGLVIEAKPTITTEGYVEVEMKFETSGIAPSSSTSDPLTPSFTTRSLNTTARMQDGVTAVVAGVKQDQNGTSRSGVPVVGMVPLLGRLFSAPNNTNSQTDIIITVTPHIKRSQGINKDDYLARVAGSQQSGPGPSIEEVVFRAQQEDEQERRLIAQQLPPTNAFPLSATSAQVATVPTANFEQNSRTESSQTVQPVSYSNGGSRSQTVINDRSVGVTPGSSRPAAQPLARPSAPIATPVAEAPVQEQPQAEPAEGETNPPATTEPSNEQDKVQAAPNNPQAPYTSALTMVQRPAGFDRARAEADAKAKVQAEARNLGSKDQLTLPLTAASRTAPAASFSLSPKAIRQQAGKVLTVTVEVSSQAQMTGANLALKFDPTRLKFKTVRDTGMLGPQPDLTYELEKGSLVVRVKQPNAAPVKASGRLITIDFTALTEGQSEIVFDGNGNQLRLTDSSMVQASGLPTQIVVTKEPVISTTNER